MIKTPNDGKAVRTIACAAGVLIFLGLGDAAQARVNFDQFALDVRAAFTRSRELMKTFRAEPPWRPPAVRIGNEIYYLDAGRVLASDLELGGARFLDLERVTALFEYKNRLVALQRCAFARGAEYTALHLWDEKRSAWTLVGTVGVHGQVESADSALVALGEKSMGDWVRHPLSRYAFVYADIPGQWRLIDERRVTSVKRAFRGDKRDVLLEFEDGSSAFVSDLTRR